MTRRARRAYAGGERDGSFRATQGRAPVRAPPAVGSARKRSGGTRAATPTASTGASPACPMSGISSSTRTSSPDSDTRHHEDAQHDCTFYRAGLDSVAAEQNHELTNIREYNASVDFYWSPLLVESNSNHPVHHRVTDRTVCAASIAEHARH